MLESIGIIDDNEIFQKILFTILSKIKIEENISLNIFKFSSPIEYITYRKEFDILILNSLFKSCPSNLNSFCLSKIAKEKNRTIKIILVSEYANEDFIKSINSENIDYYISKKTEEDKIKNFLKSIIIELDKK